MSTESKAVEALRALLAARELKIKYGETTAYIKARLRAWSLAEDAVKEADEHGKGDSLGVDTLGIVCDPLGGQYQSLKTVLANAYMQSAHGKGRERHADDDEPFEHQKICEIARRTGGPSGPVFQAAKKAYEALRLGGERGERELLGAIVYLAAAVIVMKEG